MTSPALAAAESSMTTAAPDAIEAVIADLTARLIAEPWRAGRIIRGAENMTCAEIERVVNRILPHAMKDLNWTLSLLSLRRAASSPEFGPAWDRAIVQRASVSADVYAKAAE